MIDIVSSEQGLDLGVFSTQTERAANILSVQIGSLEYEPELGIDLKYFLTEEFTFQNESFQAYLIEVLASSGINVSSVLNVVQNLFSQYTINLSPADSGTSGFVAR